MLTLSTALYPFTLLTSHSSDNLLQWTIFSFWIEPRLNESDPLSPWNQKKIEKCIFLLFPLFVLLSVFCFHVLFWTLGCSLCGFNAPWSSARSAAPSHARPAVPKPFFTTDSDSHTPVKPHVRAESLTHTLRTSRKSNNNTLFSMFPEGAQHLILGTTALDHMGPCCCSCCNSDKRKMYYVWRLGFQ